MVRLINSSNYSPSESNPTASHIWSKAIRLDLRLSVSMKVSIFSSRAWRLCAALSLEQHFTVCWTIGLLSSHFWKSCMHPEGKTPNEILNRFSWRERDEIKQSKWRLFRFELQQMILRSNAFTNEVLHCFYTVMTLNRRVFG